MRIPKNQAPYCLLSSSAPVLAIAFHQFPFGGRATVPLGIFPMFLLLFLPLPVPPPLLGQIHWLVLYPRNICLSPLWQPIPISFCLISTLACAALQEDFLLPGGAAGVHNDRAAQRFPVLRQPSADLAWGLCKHLRRRKSTFLDPAAGFPVQSPQPPQPAGTGSGKDIWDGKQD